MLFLFGTKCKGEAQLLFEGWMIPSYIIWLKFSLVYLSLSGVKRLGFVSLVMIWWVTLWPQHYLLKFGSWYQKFKKKFCVMLDAQGACYSKAQGKNIMDESVTV